VLNSILWWLGLQWLDPFFHPRLPLYIGGEAEAFPCCTSYKLSGHVGPFPILIQVSYNNSSFLIRGSPTFWASKASSTWASCFPADQDTHLTYPVGIPMSVVDMKNTKGTHMIEDSNHWPPSLSSRLKSYSTNAPTWSLRTNHPDNVKIHFFPRYHPLNISAADGSRWSASRYKKHAISWLFFTSI
jgi:hypothetical protein